MLTNTLISTVALAASASAAALIPRAPCSNYLIINTRGTFEPQGQSIAFQSANSQVQSAVPGGTLYATVYPAGADQQSGAGTDDIVKQVNDGLAKDANRCFVLEGYSQGAAATVNAMSRLTGAAFTAVRAVVLVGNPYHKAGLSSNVDEKGGDTTDNVNGISAYMGRSIPNEWLSKTLDICYKGDGICDSTNGGFNMQHLQYGSSSSVQSNSAKFITDRLRA